jgi:hypothetical protein
MRNLIVRQAAASSTSNTVSGVNFGAVCNYYADNLMVDVNVAGINSGAPSIAPFSDPSTVGRNWTGIQTSINDWATGMNNLARAGVIGACNGLGLIGQGRHGQVYLSYCKNPLVATNEIHPKSFDYINTNNCPTLLTVSSLTGQNIQIVCLDFQGNTNSGTWMYTGRLLNVAMGIEVYGFIGACMNNVPSNFTISQYNNLAQGPSFMKITEQDGAYLTTALFSVSVQAGGSGYAVNDTITLTGGSHSVAWVLKVTGVTGGAVTSVAISTQGVYTTNPANPVAQGSTSGSGSGATFNFNVTVPSSLGNAVVYRNTTGTNIEIFQPVTVNPTSGAAATVALALGPTATPTAQYTESYPANSTTGIVTAERFVVPAGFYFSLTTTNCTMGTLSVAQIPS